MRGYRAAWCIFSRVRRFVLQMASDVRKSRSIVLRCLFVEQLRRGCDGWAHATLLCAIEFALPRPVAPHHVFSLLSAESRYVRIGWVNRAATRKAKTQRSPATPLAAHPVQRTASICFVRPRARTPQKWRDALGVLGLLVKDGRLAEGHLSPAQMLRLPFQTFSQLSTAISIRTLLLAHPLDITGSVRRTHIVARTTPSLPYSPSSLLHG